MMALLPLVPLAVLLVAQGPRLIVGVASCRRTLRQWRRREAQAATYWAAVLHRNRGLVGPSLQEAVCRSLGCTPREADAAIDLLDLGDEVGGIAPRPGGAPPWV